MTRGDTVYWVRPDKRRVRCKLVATYDYPACRLVDSTGTEILAPAKEVVNAEAFQAELKAKRCAALKIKHADLIARWKPGMSSIPWRNQEGWVTGDGQRIRMLKRYGIIG